VWPAPRGSQKAKVAMVILATSTNSPYHPRQIPNFLNSSEVRDPA
jgi:hypothetical protein